MAMIEMWSCRRHLERRRIIIKICLLGYAAFIALSLAAQISISLAVHLPVITILCFIKLHGLLIPPRPFPAFRYYDRSINKVSRFSLNSRFLNACWALSPLILHRSQKRYDKRRMMMLHKYHQAVVKMSLFLARTFLFFLSERKKSKRS